MTANCQEMLAVSQWGGEICGTLDPNYTGPGVPINIPLPIFYDNLVGNVSIGALANYKATGIAFDPTRSIEQTFKLFTAPIGGAAHTMAIATRVQNLFDSEGVCNRLPNSFINTQNEIIEYIKANFSASGTVITEPNTKNLFAKAYARWKLEESFMTDFFDQMIDWHLATYVSDNFTTRMSVATYNESFAGEYNSADVIDFTEAEWKHFSWGWDCQGSWLTRVLETGFVFKYQVGYTVIDVGGGNVDVTFSHWIKVPTADLINKFQISPCYKTQHSYAYTNGHFKYDLLGAVVIVDAINQNPNIPNPCVTTPPATKLIVPSVMDCVSGGQDIVFSGIHFNPFVLPIPSLVTPPSTILLRTGSLAPIYPVKEGAFIYDLHLKKWGKMQLQYTELLDFSPVNNITTQVYPHTVFGVQAAILDTTGKIKVFDEQPAESEIVYGKIGLYRHGMTSAEEFITQHKRPFTGTIELQTSLDGKMIDPGLTQLEQFTNQVTSRSTFTAIGRWFIIKITGIWDLCYAEFRGYRVGKR